MLKKYIGRHGGAVGYLSASQLEGPGFDSRWGMMWALAACPTLCVVGAHTQEGGVDQRAFLCGVCMFSPCLLGYVPRAPTKTCNVAGDEFVQNHHNRALGEEFLIFGMMLGMVLRF